MANKQREFTRAQIKEAQRLYEETSVSQKSIAEMLEISKTTLKSRIDLWGWRRRSTHGIVRDLIIPASPAAEKKRPAPKTINSPEPPPENAQPTDWRGKPCTGLAVCPERSALVAKLWASVSRQIARIDAAHGQFVSHGAPNAGEAEGYAKLLAMLARSLRELAALDAAMQGKQGHSADDASAGNDPDALRDELAQRLAALEAGASPAIAGGPDSAGN